MLMYKIDMVDYIDSYLAYSYDDVSDEDIAVISWYMLLYLSDSKDCKIVNEIMDGLEFCYNKDFTVVSHIKENKLGINYFSFLKGFNYHLDLVINMYMNDKEKKMLLMLKNLPKFKLKRDKGNLTYNIYDLIYMRDFVNIVDNSFKDKDGLNKYINGLVGKESNKEKIKKDNNSYDLLNWIGIVVEDGTINNLNIK